MAGTPLDALVDQLAAIIAVRLETRLVPESTAMHFGRLLTVKQAALYLGRSEQAVQHLIHKRQIAIVRRADVFTWIRMTLDRWIDAGNNEAAYSRNKNTMNERRSMSSRADRISSRPRDCTGVP